MARDIETMTDGDLFITRLKVMTFGTDGDGRPATADYHDELVNEMMRRGLISESSVDCFQRGCECIQSGDYAAGVPLFEQAVAESPRFLDAYTNLGGCLIELGRPENALYALDRGREIGLTLDLLNNIERAQAMLRQRDHEGVDLPGGEVADAEQTVADGQYAELRERADLLLGRHEVSALTALQRFYSDKAQALLADRDVNGALIHFRAVGYICRELGLVEELGAALANQALVYGRDLQRPREALPLIEEAHRIAIDNGLDGLAEQTLPILETARSVLRDSPYR